MTHVRWPLSVTATHGASAGVCIWRQRGRIYATVAVKATFALVPGGTMSPCEPAAIEPRERPSAAGRGIDAPGDLAPCLLHPEIWVVGHARRAPAPGASSVLVNLAIARDATLILRKKVEIPVAPGPFVPPFLHALAPLSRQWPIRTRLLGHLDPTALDRSPIELPDAFDWTYFQAAPADQRTSPLRGDEWIRLEGILPEMPRLDTRLPRAYAAASLFGPTEALRSGQPMRIGLDSIQVDADRGTCSLVFRGYAPLPEPCALEALRVVAGVGMPDRPLPQLEDLAAAPRPPAPIQATTSPPPPGDDDDAAARTMAIDMSLIEEITRREAMPFRKASSVPPAPMQAVTFSPPPADDDEVGAQTLMISAAMSKQLAAQDPIPFRAGPAVLPIPPRPAPLPPSGAAGPVTLAPPPIDEIRARESMPFRKASSVPPAPAPASSVPPPREDDEDAGERTLRLNAAMIDEITARPATPFENTPAKPSPARPSSENEPLPPPGKLGAAFLAAMARYLPATRQRAGGPPMRHPST